jgi:hemoglobin
MMESMDRGSVFEFVGGATAFRALAEAHHRRCLEDPVLNHPFSHPGNPEHVQRLADYWSEVFGGPPLYSGSFGGQPAMLGMHAEIGDVDDDLGERFASCFLRAIDDAGLPDDPALRSVLRGYIEWATDDVMAYAPVGSKVPEDAAVPRWDWDGPRDRPR